MENRQTAMQKLWDWIDANCHEDNFNLNDAREMSLKLEKDQIVDAWHSSRVSMMTGEQYYNETYGGQTNN